MNKKLVILDVDKEKLWVYYLPNNKDPKEYIEALIEDGILSGAGTIHWHVMDNLIINNFTK